MDKENLKRLDAWYEMVKPPKELTIDEARRLNDQIRKLPKEREQLREELVLGTLHVIYAYLKDFTFIDIAHSAYDIDDMINTFCEVWIENLEQGLYKINDFSKMFNSRFFNKINEKLGISEKNSLFAHITKLDFDDIFFDFFDRQNDGEEIDYEEFMQYMSKYNNMRNINDKTKNSLKVEYTQFYQLLKRSYDIYSKYGNNNIPFAKGYINFIKNYLIEMSLTEYEDSNNIGYNYSSEDAVIAKDKSDMIKKVLESLTEEEAKVLKLHYGLETEEELTHEQIAKKLHFKSGREKSRQIEEKALMKLRHPSRYQYVREYYKSNR